MSGMRDQGVTNQIVYKFITDYDDIFRLEGEESPVMEWVKSHFNHLHYWMQHIRMARSEITQLFGNKCDKLSNPLHKTQIL